MHDATLIDRFGRSFNPQPPPRYFLVTLCYIPYGDPLSSATLYSGLWNKNTCVIIIIIVISLA